MAVESADDRAAFVNPDEFGALGVYTPAGGAAVPDIAGQFDNPFLAAGGLGEVGTADRRPTFCCDSDDLPPAAAGGDVGDTLLVAGVTYRVIELQPDGTGFTLIVLAR